MSNTLEHALDDHLDSIPAIRSSQRVSFSHIDEEMYNILIGAAKPDITIDLTSAGGYSVKCNCFGCMQIRMKQ